MKRVTIDYKTEADWLAQRALDVTSTEAAALFNASPYVTEFELHHKKAGNLPLDHFKPNERMVWGTRLESAIAAGIAEDYGLIIEPFKVYMRIQSLRMGSSFDFKIVGLVDGFGGDETARDMFRRFGPGNMEVKNIDSLQFKRNWIEDGEVIEATPQIEIQTQHQMEVADLNWTLIAPLVGGNTPKVIFRERDHELGALIRQRVARFWAMVDAATPPQPDFVQDADTIAQLYVNNDGSAVDLSDDLRLVELCKEYKSAGADEKEASERKKAARAEILTIIQRHKSIQTNGFKISAGTNKEVFKAYRREAGERITITISQIPSADVQATVPSHRNVRITEQEIAA